MSEQKPIINFAHLCDNAFLSQDGKLNIIGIFKIIKAPKVSFAYPRITCVINFTVHSPDHSLKVQVLKKESHEVIAKLEGKINHPQKTPEKEMEVGFISDFNNIKFEEFGMYKTEIWIDDELILTLPFSVELLK